MAWWLSCNYFWTVLGSLCNVHNCFMDNCRIFLSVFHILFCSNVCSMICFHFGMFQSHCRSLVAIIWHLCDYFKCVVAVFFGWGSNDWSLIFVWIGLRSLWNVYNCIPHNCGNRLSIIYLIWSNACCRDCF